MLRASDDDDDDDVDDDGDDDDDECRGPDLAQNADTHTHILCEPAQWKCMSTCHKSHQKSHFMGKIKGKMPRPRRRHTHTHTLGASLHSRNSCLHVTGDIRRATLYGNLQEKCRGPQIGPRTRTHTLCERAQAKCMSRFHKSHFRRKFTGKMPQTKLSPERGRTLCASLRNRNACLHVTRVIRRGTEIYRKNAAAQIGSRTRKDTCASLRSRNAYPHVTRDIRRATSYGKLQEKCRGPQIGHRTWTHALCEPAQSKRMSRFHKSHFIEL